MATYRSDADLAFLKHCSNDDLELLVSILTKDPKDNQSRYSEELTTCKEFRKHYPNHNQYWECIAAELQTYGANTLVTKFIRQGQGVPYREILIDVCRRKKVNFNKNASIEVIEMNLLLKMLEQSLSEMDQEQLNEFAKNMKMDLINPSRELILLSVQSAITLSGFAAYIFATRTLAMLLRQIGMKAPFVVYTSLTTAMGFLTGPIGWGITASWLASDFASPAFRVTVPACAIVAYMRQKYLNAETIGEHEAQIKEK